MSAVSARVLDGSATIGVATPLGVAPGLERKVLAKIRSIPVVGPKHRWAAVRGLIPTLRMSDAVQIVLYERGEDGRRGRGGALTADMAGTGRAPHEVRASSSATSGGDLPEHVVRAIFATGALVRIRPEESGEEEDHRAPLSRRSTARGPKHSAPRINGFSTRLGKLCSRRDGARATRRCGRDEFALRRATVGRDRSRI